MTASAERRRILQKARAEARQRLWNVPRDELERVVDEVLDEWGEPPRNQNLVRCNFRLHPEPYAGPC